MKLLVSLSLALFLLACSPPAQPTVEPAGTHLTVNGTPLEPAGAPVSDQLAQTEEGSPTAPVVDGFDASYSHAANLWVDYYGGNLKLAGSGSLPVEVNHVQYVLEVGEKGVTLTKLPEEVPDAR
jgi:hypothetical protein